MLNALLGKKACTVAPVPGETKVWQFVRLMKRIYLIDCPGIVPPDSNASPEDILLRGAVRTEKGEQNHLPMFTSTLFCLLKLETNMPLSFAVYNPAQYIEAVLKKTKKHHMARTYELNKWTDATDFIEQLSRKRGRLLAGGDADADGMARIVLNDFLRGKIPWFTPPPDLSPEEQKAASNKGREDTKKRKRDDADSAATGANAVATGTKKEAAAAAGDDAETAGAGGAGADAEAEEADASKAEDAEEFGGFGSDSAPSDFGSDEDDLISLGSISDEESDYGDEDDDGDEDAAEDGSDAEADEADGGAAVSSEDDDDDDDEATPPEPIRKPKAKRQRR